MIKAIIFDVFGVLIGDGFDATYRTAGGNPAEDKEFIEKLLDQANRAQISSEEFRRQICEHIGISVENFNEAIKKAEPLNLELLEYIKTLRPKYKTAILSNINKGGLERRFRPDFLNSHFDVVVTSGEEGYIKPEPEIYKLTADRLGVKMAECIFVDDREPYVQSAERLGMKGIVYNDLPQMKKVLKELLSSGTDN